MKYIRQFGIILLITFIGEIMHELIPIPVPAGIYGIVLLFTGLKTGIVPLSEVKDASKFLIQIMPLMFIPAAVGLIDTMGSAFSFLAAVRDRYRCNYRSGNGGFRTCNTGSDQTSQ